MAGYTYAFGPDGQKYSTEHALATAREGMPKFIQWVKDTQGLPQEGIDAMVQAITAKGDMIGRTPHYQFTPMGATKHTGSTGSAGPKYYKSGDYYVSSDALAQYYIQQAFNTKPQAITDPAQTAEADQNAIDLKNSQLASDFAKKAALAQKAAEAVEAEKEKENQQLAAEENELQYQEDFNKRYNDLILNATGDQVEYGNSKRLFIPDSADNQYKLSMWTSGNFNGTTLGDIVEDYERAQGAPTHLGLTAKDVVKSHYNDPNGNYYHFEGSGMTPLTYNNGLFSEEITGGWGNTGSVASVMEKAYEHALANGFKDYHKVGFGDMFLPYVGSTATDKIGKYTVLPKQEAIFGANDNNNLYVLSPDNKLLSVSLRDLSNEVNQLTDPEAKKLGQQQLYRLATMYAKNKDADFYQKMISAAPKFDTNGQVIVEPENVRFLNTAAKRQEIEAKKQNAEKKAEGGILKAQDGAVVEDIASYRADDLDNPVNQSYDMKVAKRAKQNNTPSYIQKAKERYVTTHVGENSEGSGELSNTDKLRLGTAVADLGSAIAAFAPTYGTAASAILGVGSTATNLFIDLADDAVTAGEAWGSAAAGLGLDAMGLIPGGGTASKISKIAKTLGKSASVILASSALQQVPEQYEAVKKLLTPGVDVTAADLRNAVNGLTTVLGGTAAAGRYMKTNKSTRKITNQDGIDSVAIKVKNQNGESRLLAFDGADATKIRQAEKNGNVEEVLKDLYQGNEVYTLDRTAETTSWLPSLQKGEDNKRHWTRTTKPGKVQLVDLTESASPFWSKNKNNYTPDQTTVNGSQQVLDLANLRQKYANDLAEANKAFTKAKGQEKAVTTLEQMIETNKNNQTAVNTTLDAVNKARQTYNTHKSAHDSDANLQKLHDEIEIAKQDLDKAKANTTTSIDAIQIKKNTGAPLTTEEKEVLTAQAILDQVVAEHNNKNAKYNLTKLDEEMKNAQAAYDAAMTEATKSQKVINALQDKHNGDLTKHIADLRASAAKHSKAYEDLVNLAKQGHFTEIDKKKISKLNDVELQNFIEVLTNEKGRSVLRKAAQAKTFTPTLDIANLNAGNFHKQGGQINFAKLKKRING